MQITCLGAAGQVTGSCFLLHNGENEYLIDCGLFQGGRETEALNRQQWPFRPQEIGALFLTHAHIDHCGRIPKLFKDGFRGRIYATLPTVELCKILLIDAAHIQEMEAEWQSRKNRRAGKHATEPLYTVADAEACFTLFQVIQKNELISIDPQLRVRYRDAGHILGSSLLEVWIGDSANPHKVVFSGDLGRKDQLIVQDPQTIFDADTLFIESTYGNRNHKSFEDSTNELLEAIHYSYAHKEKILIPAFAVERTQEMLYILGEFFRQGRIPSMPVYLDSPLAIAATEIFRRMKTFYDDDADAIVNKGFDPFDFPQLILTRSTQESMRINEQPGAAIIIAGNGMCTAGRIKHHLKHNLWRRGAALVIVGFQAEGTLGRKIIEGARSVRVFGEPIAVHAKIYTIGGFSAHAGQSELLEWISHFENPHMRVYIIHGERSISENFAAIVQKRFKLQASVATVGEDIRLVPTEAIAAAEEPKWQERLALVANKLAEVKSIGSAKPEAFSPQVLAKLADELSRVEDKLDEVLRLAQTEAS
jgi:metallo-beta-lactamase family protein